MIEVWDDIASMQRRLDELFREFFGPRARLSYPALPLFLRRPFLPATDVFTRGDDIVVRMELAGIDPEKDVAITLDEGDVVIRGERRRSEEVKDEAYYRMESEHGTFERRIPIPEGVDEKEVLAEYIDGVLEVTVPKAAKVERPPTSKRIPIKTTKQVKTAKAA
jgi:HSP20 family molecular chaperone IbpA